jgi:hypothetical protein
MPLPARTPADEKGGPSSVTRVMPKAAISAGRTTVAACDQRPDLFGVDTAALFGNAPAGGRRIKVRCRRRRRARHGGAPTSRYLGNSSVLTGAHRHHGRHAGGILDDGVIVIRCGDRIVAVAAGR